MLHTNVPYTRSYLLREREREKEESAHCPRRILFSCCSIECSPVNAIIKATRPGRRSHSTESGHVVRIPALRLLHDWFTARYSRFVLNAYSIRDRVPRQTFPFPSQSRVRPLPPFARLHSLPSEITAVLLTAFSHVLHALCLSFSVTRGREREKERLAEEDNVRKENGEFQFPRELTRFSRGV